ncbi:hypothetical protein IMCC1989_1221 [gamma proteobacterium IMCC1989]|nr:hypothetical protein IMCC1989_1221 [gamma proteobacterium IMCC1989]
MVGGHHLVNVVIPSHSYLCTLSPFVVGIKHAGFFLSTFSH